MSVHSILAQRGARYGNFTDQAEHCLIIKGTIFGLMGIEKVQTLKSDQIEAISNIANKLARITNGDPHYHDSWQDIAGYAQLVADRLIADEKAQAAQAAQAIQAAQAAQAIQAAQAAQAQAEPTDEQAEEFCDCPACQIRSILQVHDVVLVVETDEEVTDEGEEQVNADIEKVRQVALDALREIINTRTTGRPQK